MNQHNIVEGEFGVGKRSYGLNRIMAHLQETSFCVIGIALLCMNLAKRLRSLLNQFLRIWFLTAPSQTLYSITEGGAGGLTCICRRPSAADRRFTKHSHIPSEQKTTGTVLRPTASVAVSVLYPCAGVKSQKTLLSSRPQQRHRYVIHIGSGRAGDDQAVYSFQGMIGVVLPQNRGTSMPTAFRAARVSPST